MKKRTLGLSLLLVLLCAGVITVHSPSVLGQEEPDPGLIHEYYSEESGTWVEFDPDTPDPYNSDPDKYWIPAESRELPYPYGSDVRERHPDDLYQYYDQDTDEWVEYDPVGEPHPTNQEEGVPEYARNWPHPWDFATRVIKAEDRPDFEAEEAATIGDFDQGAAEVDEFNQGFSEFPIFQMIDAILDALFGMFGIPNIVGSVSDRFSSPP